MKKIVQINVVCNGSTGKIMCDIATEANKDGFETYCFYGRGLPNKNLNCIEIGNKLSTYLHVLLARIGFNGHGSYFATKKLVKQLKQINSDVIHLHNIHGYYINLKVLFNYLKKEFEGKIIWTLHDCWAFTGHCSYFDMIKCKQWKKECKSCPQLNCYPRELLDTTRREYQLKKKLFAGLHNLTIVTPSKWLANLVKLSFLKKCDVKVINNGIDINLFKPVYDEYIYDKYGIPNNKKIILGVANIWEERKGLNDFIDLANIIDDKYVIVLVGVDIKIQNKLPKKIIPITRTADQKDLVKLYSVANVLFNPTYEDNYPTVNLESIACNTTVVTYDTGGSGEAIKKYGRIIEKKDYLGLLTYLNKKNTNKFSQHNIISKENMYKSYLGLYK